MAIHHLPPRPTVANPDRRRDLIERAIEEIDAEVTYLYCIHSALCGSTKIPEEAVEALATCHKRLRRRCDELFAVM